MKMKKLISILILVVLVPAVETLGIPVTGVAETSTIVRLDPSDASPFNNGEFQGWGTALCWWANRIGYSEKMTKQAAELFFSENGLGLDIARYNLGGGDDPTHVHINRSDSKVPGVWSDFELSEDGKNIKSITYDITKDQNQLNIAKAALASNPDLYFEGFSNSAPYFMTQTGCTSGGGVVNDDGTVTSDAGKNNLKDDMYDDFGKFIADATKLFRKEGIVFQSYSPMNEPDTKYWGAYSDKQEGCHFDPGASQSKAIVETRKALDAAGLADVLVAGMDETSLKSTASNLDKLTEEAKDALGRIDTHTYNDRNYHAQVKTKAVEMRKNLWQSEVDKGGNGLTLASMIIEDMNGMQPSAWVMWDIVDFHKDSKVFQYPANSGIYPEANHSVTDTSSLWGVGMADHDNEELIMTNKYYAYGQFTKYINPGDTIIASSSNTLAAYNKKSGDIKIVALNASSSDLPYIFDLSAFTSVGDTVKEIRTNNGSGNSAEHWKEIKGEATLADKKISTTLKAESITTYIVKGNAEATLWKNEITASSSGLSYAYSPLTDYDRYVTAYDNGVLTYIARNKGEDSVAGDFSGDTVKTFLWDGVRPTDVNVAYAVICGGSEQIDKGTSLQLELHTNLQGDVKWSVSNNAVASITQDGILTTTELGTVTVYAEIDRFKFSRTFDVPFKGEIKGVGRELRKGVSARLSLEANISGNVKWSVSDEGVASITSDGLLTAKETGTVTVIAEINGYTVEKQITINLYTLTGTPSWGNDTTAPKDSDDYTRVADGDLNTFFDGVQHGYVQYDYGTPFKISKVKLAARSGNGMSDRTVGGTVQGSSDGITWTDLYKITSAIPSGRYTEINAAQLADQKAYRYFRYTNSTNMANIAEFLIEGSESDDVPENAPVVGDITELTDNFEGDSNMFNAKSGAVADGGNVVFNSGLGRFGNVFAPVKATAVSRLDTSLILTDKDKFRITFNMFAGWEDKGAENTFALKDEEGNELVAFKITGGGYNFNEIRIGGQNVLTAATIAQSRSNPPGNKKSGANGWDAGEQPYRNTVGYNKTVEIVIDGAGNVTVSATGGMEDTAVKGNVSAPVTIKSIEINGNYKTDAKRTVSYDNFDADLITYSESFKLSE